MVCIYCGGETKVANSRLQQQHNHIWRRRTCLACAAVFTTKEQPELDTTFMVDGSTKRLQPFKRDQLLISIFESCKHRRDALDDATFLTKVILGKLQGSQRTAVIRREEIVSLACQILGRFDQTAAAVYAAYHPLPED